MPQDGFEMLHLLGVVVFLGNIIVTGLALRAPFCPPLALRALA